MVWDKPMDPGQTEPEWQKRFEVIITHGEKESIELAKGGFKKAEGQSSWDVVWTELISSIPLHDDFQKSIISIIFVI